MSDVIDAKIVKYEFEIPIKRKPEDVWELIVNDINAWWMNDFRALGEGSKMSFKAEAGGQLIETAADGTALEWYRVQMISPGKLLYLIGYMAPDWGGPTTSMLKLTVEERGGETVLIVSDALLGNVTQKSADSASSGWKMLFGEGLKAYAEGQG